MSKNTHLKVLIACGRTSIGNALLCFPVHGELTLVFDPALRDNIVMMFYDYEPALYAPAIAEKND